MFAKIVWVSVTGMLMYKLVMSNEVSQKWGSIGVLLNLCIRSLEFSVLKALGRGARWPTFCVNSLASLYAGALGQFTMGQMGWSGLCSFIKTLMVGAEGFMLMYFHLVSWYISVLLVCIVFWTDASYIFVGSVGVIWKLFDSIKLCILESYCWVGRMTRVLPLSALVTVALLLWSLEHMLLMVLASCCALRVGGWLLSNNSYLHSVLVCVL